MKLLIENWKKYLKEDEDDVVINVAAEPSPSDQNRKLSRLFFSPDDGNAAQAIFIAGAIEPQTPTTEAILDWARIAREVIDMGENPSQYFLFLPGSEAVDKVRELQKQMRKAADLLLRNVPQETDLWRDINRMTMQAAIATRHTIGLRDERARAKDRKFGGMSFTKLKDRVT